MELNFSVFKRDDAPILFKPQIDFFIPPEKDIPIFNYTIINVLVVVDRRIEYGENGSFGVGRFIRLLRETRIAGIRFKVDIATRPAHVRPTTPEVAKYKDFKFDSENDDGELVLNNYHELFIFASERENDPMIGSNELTVLHSWMSQGGGLFATGDHEDLGAAMCSTIPRVGTMRKWTNDDGVPSRFGSTRIETVQPANESQAAGMGIIGRGGGGSPEQEDSIPQPIQWVSFRTRTLNNFTSRSVIGEPHPILCHPNLGVIDVMPDHAHEGCCFDTEEIKYDAKLKFSGNEYDEYPTFEGFQPKPRIIATGSVVARNNYGKGIVDQRTFPMISVYDGREKNSSGTGRVVVDSTWHHWFNLNLKGLEEAGNKANWNKISRYFINIATWIAPKNIKSKLWLRELINSHFEAPAIEEITSSTSILETGSVIFHHLASKLGPCEVTLFTEDNICNIWPEVCEEFLQEVPSFGPGTPPVCLSCVPHELYIYTYLGAAYRATQPMAESLNKRVFLEKKEFEIKESTIVAEIADRASFEFQVLGEKVFADVEKLEHLFQRWR